MPSKQRAVFHECCRPCGKAVVAQHRISVSHMLVCWTAEPMRTHQLDERITLALDAPEQLQSPRVLLLHTQMRLLVTGSRLRSDLHTGGSGARSGHSVIQAHRDAS